MHYLKYNFAWVLRWRLQFFLNWCGDLVYYWHNQNRWWFSWKIVAFDRRTWIAYFRMRNIFFSASSAAALNQDLQLISFHVSQFVGVFFTTQAPTDVHTGFTNIDHWKYNIFYFRCKSCGKLRRKKKLAIVLERFGRLDDGIWSFSIKSKNNHDRYLNSYQWLASVYSQYGEYSVPKAAN